MPDPVSMAIIGSSVIGAGASIFGANKAADAQSQAADKATAAQMQMFQQAQAQGRDLFNQGKTTETDMFNAGKDTQLGMLDDATRVQQPYADWGASGMSPLSKLITPGPDQTAALEQTPGYQFALSQGEKAITNQATTRGLSGNAMREGGTFASGLAQNTWSDVVGKLMAQVGVGQTSATNIAGQKIATGANIGNQGASTGIAIGNQSVGLAGQMMNNATTVGGNIGNNITGAGNAQGAAAIATGNAIGGATSNYANSVMLNQLTGGKLFGATDPNAGANLGVPIGATRVPGPGEPGFTGWGMYGGSNAAPAGVPYTSGPWGG